MNFTPPHDRPWTIRARWVFPVDAPPIADGRVTIHGERIVQVVADGPADLDVGNAALLPGFVNAHTHLDLGMLHGKCPPTPDLPAWLRCVIAGRMAASAEQVQQAIAEGIDACLHCGTTLLGDISAGGGSWTLLSQAPLRSVVFYELLGLPRERADRAWRAAQEWLHLQRSSQYSKFPEEYCQTRCSPGLSPHAPYSVHRVLFRHAAHWAQRRVPAAVHVAESRAELQLLRELRGPFVDFLKELNVWAPEGLVSGPTQILEMFAHAPGVLIVHANYLPADAPLYPGQTVVFCPRTHAAFGHPRHPLPALLERGRRVVLGTDSLASNPDLDILTEARFVHAHYPEVNGDALLRMLTLDGATALGWGDETGSLTPGKYADLVVLPLPEVEAAYPHALLWEFSQPVQAVLIGGAWAVPFAV